MTIRNLDALFKPNAIALLGASNRPNSVGAVLGRNLFQAGFAGPILTVNPKERAIRSVLNYRSVTELPIVPDLAVICTPPPTVPVLIAELGQRGCRAAIVITAGFGEAERMEGQQLRQAMLAAAKPYLLRVVGPNCLGVMSSPAGINASFAHLTPQAGDIAFLTQSGAVATSVLDWASARGIGFSHIVSLGSMSDVDFGDLLDYLALDAGTRGILLYVEAITQARKFLSAARMASRTKPVIVIKTGRTEAGAKAALSHTGALAGSDAVYEAAFQRAGMLRVATLGELFEALGTVAAGIHAKGDRLAVLTNGGGIGVLAVDEMAHGNGQLASLSADTIARLDKLLPGPWSRGNPVDILGDAPGNRYAAALEALLSDPGCDAFLVLNCPTAVADSLDAAQAVVAALAKRPVPVLACWLGEGEARRLFAANKLPSYETPERAVQAFGHLIRYRRNQKLLMEVPPSASERAAIDRLRADAVVASVLKDGRTVLTEPEAKDLLSAYNILTVPCLIAKTPEEASELAGRVGFPVVLKVLSRDILHKSDLGGVQLNLASPGSVQQAGTEILENVRRKAPEARIEGFTVQPMIRRPFAHELIAGIADDAVFGPVILFGQGGTAVEVIGDRVIGLPPLNPILAHEMIERTRISRLLRGYRDRPPADLDSIARTLVKLSQLVCDLDRIAELDINPLLADVSGVVALDARVVLRRGEQAARPIAIRPYPRELEQEIATYKGCTFLLRPIRPEDTDALVLMLSRSSPGDMRLRFFAPVKEVGRSFAARLTQIDYEREMALVAIAPESGELIGLVHLIADPDKQAAEFAVMVRSDLKGAGVGYALMTRILDYARTSGIARVVGEILRENSAMLHLAKELGFKAISGDDEAEVMRVELGLSSAERR